MTRAAIYARVSTTEQDETRQIEDCRQALEDHAYAIESIETYADVMTGTTTDRPEYRRLVDDVESGEVDFVIATEVSRLSRSGSQEVMSFITRCIENGVSVTFTQSPISIMTEDDAFTQAVQRMLVSLLSELANIEHKQKMARIESGINSAQSAGKWTGRAPRGFFVDEDSGVLRVDPSEFLRVRAALERVVDGDTISSVAESTGIPESTLRTLRDDRLDLYFQGEHDDDRVDQALEGVRPLPDVDVDQDVGEIDDLRERLHEVEQALQEK